MIIQKTPSNSSGDNIKKFTEPEHDADMEQEIFGIDTFPHHYDKYDNMIEQPPSPRDDHTEDPPLDSVGVDIDKLTKPEHYLDVELDNFGGDYVSMQTSTHASRQRH